MYRAQGQLVTVKPGIGDAEGLAGLAWLVCVSCVSDSEYKVDTGLYLMNEDYNSGYYIVIVFYFILFCFILLFGEERGLQLRGSVYMFG